MRKYLSSHFMPIYNIASWCAFFSRWSKKLLLNNRTCKSYLYTFKIYRCRIFKLISMVDFLNSLENVIQLMTTFCSFFCGDKRNKLRRYHSHFEQYCKFSILTNDEYELLLCHQMKYMWYDNYNYKMVVSSTTNRQNIFLQINTLKYSKDVAVIDGGVV